MAREAAILISLVDAPAYLHYPEDLLLAIPLTSLPLIRPLPQRGRYQYSYHPLRKPQAITYLQIIGVKILAMRPPLTMHRMQHGYYNRTRLPPYK
jgi:hypothetical protein